jgi:amino-acid N-acetyltransferase
VSDVALSQAGEADIESIKAILRANDLPIAGVDQHWRTFMVARVGERIVGCSGAEAYPVAALIRSVDVLPEYRSHGVGASLVNEVLERLASRGLRDFYLLTTTAENYFRKRGFEPIDRGEVHPQLLASREFQDACPKSAVCMRLLMPA